MSSLKQIIYNLNTGGSIISTSKANDGVYIEGYENTNNKIDIFNNLVPTSGNNRIIKLGIQAPPGTKFVLNDQQFLVGRTGIFEFNEDVSITNFYFKKPLRYTLDERTTEAMLQEGEQGMITAENNRSEKINILNSDYGDKIKDEEYWNRYIEIQQTYNQEYNTALNSYNQGINGVYSSTGSDGDATALKNVIVDYVLE